MSGLAASSGLQQERTRLAWRRTNLSLTVAALIIGKLAVEESVPGPAVGGVVATVLILWLGLVALRRGRCSLASRRESEFTSVLRDGKVPLAVAVTAGGLCLIALALSVGVVGAL